MSELPAGSRFDEEYLTDCEPIDWPEFGRWMRFTPGQRIQTMLHAHRLAAGPVRGRLPAAILMLQRNVKFYCSFSAGSVTTA